MDLFTWLRHNRVTQGSLAKTIGVSLTTISNIVRNTRTPGLALALKIYYFTKMQIDMTTLLSKEDANEIEVLFPSKFE